jgi:hypothetical protein
MTHTKDKALRLADALDCYDHDGMSKAAAELRRLHGENERLKAAQPAREPVAWRAMDANGKWMYGDAPAPELPGDQPEFLGVIATPAAQPATPAPEHPDPLAILKRLGPKQWETSPEAHAQTRLIIDFEEAYAASKTGTKA